MSVFSTVLCGFGGADEAEHALRQAVTLVDPSGKLIIATIADTRLAHRTGWDAPRVRDDLRDEARRARDRAQEPAADQDDAEAIVVEGRPDPTMLWLTHKRQPTMVVVGSHGRRRARGIALGSAATALLHSAPCPVLVARASRDPDGFPRSIVLGVDGSQQSLKAAAVAAEVRRRFGAPIRMLVARGGKGFDPTGLQQLHTDDLPEPSWDERRAFAALTAPAWQADLVVVGSRGVHGLRALGSVSERVAHAATSSVLVVR